MLILANTALGRALLLTALLVYAAARLGAAGGECRVEPGAASGFAEHRGRAVFGTDAVADAILRWIK